MGKTRLVLAVALVVTVLVFGAVIAGATQVGDGQVKHAMTEAGIYNFSGGVVQQQ